MRIKSFLKRVEEIADQTPFIGMPLLFAFLFSTSDFAHPGNSLYAWIGLMGFIFALLYFQFFIVHVLGPRLPNPFRGGKKK